MKLTESKLKKLIVEMMSKREQAEKIFSLIKKYIYSDENVDFYNQAVSLTAGANLVNEVLEVYDEFISREMTSPEFYYGPSGFTSHLDMSRVYDEYVRGRDQFYKDVAREISLSVRQK